jgi:hypothetical protein
MGGGRACEEVDVKYLRCLSSAKAIFLYHCVSVYDLRWIRIRVENFIPRYFFFVQMGTGTVPVPNFVHSENLCPN